MGLDAVIPCDCYRQGRATTCPVDPQFIDDDHGILYVKDQSATGEAPDDATVELFWEWLRTACPHPHQQLFSTRIGSWWSTQLFYDCLEQTTTVDVTTLRNIMPQMECEIVTPNTAIQALEELENFTKTPINFQGWALVNELTGDEFCHTSRSSTVVCNDNGAIHFDADGIIITNKHKTSFRTQRLTQRTNFGIPTLTTDTGQQVFGLQLGNQPADWVVRQRAFTGGDLSCAQPLSQTLRTSIQHQMPIHMCY